MPPGQDSLSELSAELRSLRTRIEYLFSDLAKKVEEGIAEDKRIWSEFRVCETKIADSLRETEERCDRRDKAIEDRVRVLEASASATKVGLGVVGTVGAILAAAVAKVLLG